jgi:Xaa-Pro aminopeptidase
MTLAVAHPREAALADLLAAENLDAIVACSYEALCYFAGTDIRSQLILPERLAFFVAGTERDPSLLVCNIEESQVRSQSTITDVQAYVEFEHDPASQLATLLVDRGIVQGRVGVELHRLPAAAVRTFEQQLPGVEFVGVDVDLARLQTAKAADEIEQLGALARGLLASLDRTISALGAAASEGDYADELLGQVARTGALPIFLFFASGPRTALGHPEAERSPMREGSLWRTDFGGRLAGGICGDVARTGVVGGASEEQAEIFAAVRAAQDDIVALAEPGRPARDLFNACKSSFAKNGLPFLMPHVGHGIGVGLHEAPLLEPRNNTPLAVGTVMMIEPFAVFADRGEGYHTEDMIVVTADGPQRLSTPQDELLVIS